MLSVSEAEATIFNLVSPLDNQQDTEIVDLLAADSRILASAVTSQMHFPYWDNSAMDGYAVRYADVQQATQQQPAILEIVEEIPAGYQPQSTIEPGQAARIFTGAVMPAGADTVVMQENTQQQENRVLILTAPQKPQEFVRQRAAYYQAGTQLLPPGIMLNGAEIAVLATAQCTQVSVYRRPRVAIFSTGNELVPPEKPLQPGQIVDSNQYALAALVRQSGAEPLMLGIVPDEPTALEKAIAYAVSNADIVISSGGVSVGDYDYVQQIIESLKGKIHIQAVAMKPGKPLTVATFRNQVIYFGLPGNPASALVTFWRFVQPTIKKVSGLVDGWQPKFIKAFTRQELRSDGKRETYFWGKLHLQNGIYEFQLAGGSQSSGNLINLAQTNALAAMSVGQTLISSGEEVQVLLN
ncbi:molybdopterin molybdenumtransferase [Fischerella thermalis CCMEE 5208]|uniref:molybdopterin molybdotransferase MoeA n=1 Tax=Fischerella thermalis TaxID=372787 RepID=UPI000C80C48F|nr:gephyrin-like molybdotransferase Glp [Fischerella thermalis]PMB30790.1 molybdopterin molybdenumtransferase [Fischerella thermalis CCMEE 5208]